MYSQTISELRVAIALLTPDSAGEVTPERVYAALAFRVAWRSAVLPVRAQYSGMIAELRAHEILTAGDEGSGPDPLAVSRLLAALEILLTDLEGGRDRVKRQGNEDAE
jgi:hypothetical protein